MNQARKPRLRLANVDAEQTGVTPHDLVSRGVCLLREEYISLSDLGHNIGVSLDFVMMNAFAVDDLTHPDEVR